MSMRTDATFITIPYSRLTNNYTLPVQNAGGINILIDTPDFDIAAILKYVQTNQCELIYSLSGTIVKHNSFSSLFPRIYLLHTLCDYFIKNRGVIPVFSATATDDEELTSLKNYFDQQGEQITFVFFEPNSAEAQLKNTLLYVPAKAESAPKAGIENLFSQEINLVLTDDNFTVKQNEWHLLFHNAAATKEAGWGVYKSALWHERSKLYLSFIALGKKVGETEYYDLRQWYHNEYEVLPLWFKRLGHIVKVATGKRSVKSLFPNRKKKH